MLEETKPVEREPTKLDLFWACEYPACACECGHIAGKCEYCHWVGAVFCRCPFVCESTGRLRAGDICPVHGPKPAEREANAYYQEHFGSAWDSNKSIIISALIDYGQASAAAALERAAALMRTMAEDLGKQGYDEFHKAADAIRALKGSH